MSIAYLVNQYPKVSHTFVRREIEALEAIGLPIRRYSIRPPDEALVDDVDRAEVDRTSCLLDVGARGLAAAVARMAAQRPHSFARASALATKIGWRSDRGAARNFAYLAEAAVLAELTQAHGIRHVHAHFGTNSAAVAMLCHALGGPTYSFTAHGPEEFDKPDLLHLREKIEHASFVVAISSYGRGQLYRHATHEHWSKIHVVRCGVDPLFLDAPKTPLPARPRLVSVGRLTEQKGQLLLVEAARRLGKAGTQFELVLVGDGEMRGALETRIRTAGLEDRVRITGWASGLQVRQELEAARLFVLPSFAEGLPVVLMEALALGRPVLTTSIAGIPELVTDGECGWLVPAGSVEALETALRQALEAPDDVLTRMGDEGRRCVRELHDVRREAENLAALFSVAGAERGADEAGSRRRAASGRCRAPRLPTQYIPRLRPPEAHPRDRRR